jgi:hypothetical protein
MNLKDQLIQLGETNPDLQDHLRAILDHLCAQPDEDASVKTEEAPEGGKGIFDARPLPNPESEKTFFDKSPASFRAFNTVILPQIQAKLDNASFQDLHAMMEEMEGLGKAKNHELENALIVFKPISMSTRRFYQEIQQVFQDWIRPKLKLQGGGSDKAPTDGAQESGGEEGKKEYNFVFK